jgi:D-glycero-D-manno-heptose 1,7-bisphosphate phosphatase
MRAAFLDRDGVINRNAPPGDYVKWVQELEILPGAPEAIRILNDLGFVVIVVTNQRGVSLGTMSIENLEAIHSALTEQLAAAGARLDAIYYCPHAEHTCDCRKPATGMFRQALERFPDVALNQSVVVGDSWRDMDAASALGCARVLVAESEKAQRCANAEGIETAGSLIEAVKRYVVPGEKAG